jgi:hypothetical protein
MALQFGYNRGLPPGRTVAWGARLIVTQSGGVDMLHDRQGAIGPDEPRRRLVDHLNTLDPGFLDRISRLLRDGAMRTGTAEDFVVHSDKVVIVRANTNASCGYCYVVAYFVNIDDERARS